VKWAGGVPAKACGERGKLGDPPGGRIGERKWGLPSTSSSTLSEEGDCRVGGRDLGAWEAEKGGSAREVREGLLDFREVKGRTGEAWMTTSKGRGGRKWRKEQRRICRFSALRRVRHEGKKISGAVT